MASLASDGWFWVSTGGFLVSSMLFVFLLGQYRAAVEAEDEASDEELPQPVLLTAASTMPSKALEPKAEAAAPKPAATAQPPAKRPDLPVATSGATPAVIYLQNLKGQMERLDKDIVNLKALASQQAAQSDQILKMLAMLSQKLDVESLRAAMPIPAQAPQPQPAAALEPNGVEPAAQTDTAEPSPEPVVAELPLEPPTAAAHAVAALEGFAEPHQGSESPDSTIKLSSPPELAAAPQSAPQPSATPEAQPARKGPVWPI